MSDRTGSLRAAGTLRSLTLRLASASTRQLPVLIPQIARALPDCQILLSSSESEARKDSADAVVLHRFNTQVSALLSHKSPEGRWAAVVLIKACVGLGGHTVMTTCAPWVRGLLNILNKPNPLSTQKMCVITLTRIFALTRSYHTLVREVTTPSLPVFVTACLHLAANPNKTPLAASSHLGRDLLQTILNSFCALIPNHPSIFRNFRTQIQTLLDPLVAPTRAMQNLDTDMSVSDPKVIEAARSLYSALHFTAPKAGSSSEYSKTFAQLIAEAHETADRVFRAVLESWQSVAGKAPAALPHDGDVSAPESSLGFSPWNGVYAGCERLVGLAALLQAFVSTQTAAAVSIPLGPLVDLLLRICTITIPPSKESNQNVKLNENISKEEREALWSQLPGIHVAAVELIRTLCGRLGTGVQPLHQTFIEIIVWVFRHEHHNELVRISSYAAMSSIIDSSGSGLSKDYISQMTLLIATSCKDVLPPPNEPDGKPGLENALEAAVANVSPSLPQDSSGVNLTVLRAAAITLLTAVLSRVPVEYLSRSLRSQLDQTAVLCNDTHLMLASVLNPSPHKALEKAYSSILPFLARSKPESVEVEGLLRPRMPVVQTQADQVQGVSDEASDEDSHLDPLEPRDDVAGSEFVDANQVSESLHPPVPFRGDEASSSLSSTLHHKTSVPNEFSTLRRSYSNDNEDGSRGPSTHTNQESKASTNLDSHKRVTSNETLPEPDSKRPRLEPRAPEGQAKNYPHDSAEPNPQSQPIVIAMPDQALNSQVETAPAKDIQEKGLHIEEDGEDDDDDFVIPELTLDPDTEDEDEDEAESPKRAEQRP